MYNLTSYSPNLDMSSLFPSVDVTTGVDILVRPGQRTLIPDFLDQNYLNLLNQIRYWTNAIYRGQKFTTLCFKYQQTTSLWNLNLAFNGLSSPMELQAGMSLRFPFTSEVQRILALQGSVGVGSGKTFTI